MTIIGDGEQTAAGIVNQVPGGSTVTGTASDLGLLARKRQQFNDAGNVTTYDPTQVGGESQTIHYDAGGGQGTIVGGGSGGDDPTEMNRYRGMGAAAAQRQAYQANFGLAQGDEAQGFQDRNSQYAATDLLRGAAQGQAPSQAAILGGQAAGQGLQAQLGAGANARGGMGQAAAQMQAANGVGQQQLGAVGQYAAMRGNEMNHAQSAYGAAGTSLRSGDATQQGMAQQRSDAQAQSEDAQRGLNQAAQLGYEQMGINNQQAQSDGDIRRAAMTAQSNADATSSHDARNARNMDIAVGGMKAVATLGTGSDERMKENVRPLRDESDGRGEMHYDADVLPTKPDVTSGASLSGPTPRYSAPIAAAEAPKPQGIGHAAAKHKLSDAELDKLAANMRAQLDAQRSTLTAPPSVQGAIDRSAAPPEPGAHYGEDDMAYSDERTKQGAREPDMGHALEQGFKPFEYEYKDGFRERERQQPGEKNVGPMAQNMASNPITGSAVKQGEDGLLMVDIPKATKVNSAGIGYLAARLRKQDEEIARLKGDR